MEKDGRKKNIFAPDILVVIRGQKTYNGARKQEEKTTMLKFGMPTLIEIPEPEQCAALCRELELSFVEMNMNLPQYQVQTMDVSRLKGIAKEYGIGYTIHLDENMNVADFNPLVAGAYRQTVLDTITLAKELEIPVLNMHFPLGVYFTLPDRKVYVMGEYPEKYRERMEVFRDACTAAIGDSGIRICVENWSGYADWQLPALDALLQSPAFGLTYDVGHNFCKDGVDEPVILARKAHLHHMHIHDVKDGIRDHQALGTGQLDKFKYLDLARQQDCTVVVETKTVDGLRQSVRWLREHQF